MLLAAPPTADIILFTAVASERKAIRDTARELGLSFDKTKSKLGEYVDLGRVGPSRVLAVETTMGPFAATGSTAKALQWLAATQARAIIGVGMAFGVDRSRQKHGDVLVSTAVLPYDNRRVTGGAGEAPTFDYTDVKTYPARPQLLALFERAARLPDWVGRVHLGAFLSGAARIHSATFRDDLVRAFPDRGPIVGGDMEGIGLLASSDETESRWLLVKGISDFADDRRDAEIAANRPGACYNAAKFVLSSLLAEETLRAQSR